MNQPINSRMLFVKERPDIRARAYNCDIIDPATGATVMLCREIDLSGTTRFLRLFNLLKQTTPFNVGIHDIAGNLVASVKKGVPVSATCVEVYDQHGELIGGFRENRQMFKKGLDVLDANSAVVCRLEGGLTGSRSYRFLTPESIELARVTKKWGGLGRELFTGADDYMLEIDEAVPPDGATRRLILSSVVAIGLIFKIEIP